MFKRIAILSILLMYLGTTVGFAMSLHFCGTEFTTIGINSDEKKSCCADEAKSKSDKCCKDKQIEVKVSDQQQAMNINKVPAPVNINLFSYPLGLTNKISGLPVPKSNLSNLVPPVISNIPFRIQNSVFRI